MNEDKTSIQDANIEDSNMSKCQVLITGISWNKNANGTYKTKYNSSNELPTLFTLDLPESILNRANKKLNDFNDIIEEFCYNFLTRKFGHEVYHCQIWLPL